jgi:hypothetical protein
MKEILDRPILRSKKTKKGPPKTLENLLEEVDPNWRYVVPRFFTDKDPNPILTSLFHNPFVGVWAFKDRTKPIRKSFKTGFHEVYSLDRRRADKYLFHRHVRMLVEKAFTRFAYSQRGNNRKRRGLFAACLYVEAMLECFKDIKTRTDILGSSERAKQYIRQRLVAPRKMKRWASCFHLSEETIMRRIRELRQEMPIIGRTIDFVKSY